MQPQNSQLTPSGPQTGQPIISKPEGPASNRLNTKLLVAGAVLIILLALVAIIYIATKPKQTAKVALSNTQSTHKQVQLPAKTGITDSWTGKGKTINWSDTANWSNGLPAKGDNLVFTAINGVLATNNDLSAVTFGSLTFEGGPKSGINQVIVSGNRIILLKGINDNTASSVNVDFNTSIVLAASQTFTVHSTFGVDPSSSPNLAGTVVDIGKYVLTIVGLSNSSTTINSLSGSGQMIVNLSQDNTASMMVNQPSPNFSGSTQLSSGTSTIANTESLGSGTINVANGAQLVVKSNSNSSVDISNNLSLAGNGPNSDGAVVVSGGVQSCTLLGNVNLTANASFGFTDPLGTPLGGQVNLVNQPALNGFTFNGSNQAKIVVQ